MSRKNCSPLWSDAWLWELAERNGLSVAVVDSGSGTVLVSKKFRKEKED